eukprot:m.178189 g.178189  ORF g.178189 m.178189 type:complete len:468 (-) comp25357_c0_seq4:254-1657(-)
MPPNNNDDWVSLAFLQTLLPGSAWGGVASALAPQLVERVRAKVDRVETRQMLFELLGESFVAKHFPSSPDTPLLLEPPFLSSTARKELHQTTRKWLLDTIKELVVNSRESLEQQTYSGFATKVFRDVVDEHLENKELEDQGAVLAAAITGVCSNFPELFSKVQARFVGKLLPPALRRTMWALKLSDADEVAKTTAILARNAKSAGAGTTSSLSSLITRVTKEKFASIPALKPQNTLVMRERCVQVLNLFHVYNDGYEPRMILLLFPILVTFFNSATDTPQAVVSHFVHFIDSCMPPRDKIFEMASRVWDTLGSVDSDLQEQILRVSKDIQSVEKSFLPFPSSSTSQATLTQAAEAHILSHPLVLIRKWLGEGLVGVASHAATLFVWDHCFLLGWQNLEDFALVFLLLLREPLMKASNFAELREVFMTAPSKLYTKDIIRAWRHLKTGSSLAGISAFNTQTAADSNPK